MNPKLKAVGFDGFTSVDWPVVITSEICSVVLQSQLSHSEVTDLFVPGLFSSKRDLQRTYNTYILHSAVKTVRRV